MKITKSLLFSLFLLFAFQSAKTQSPSKNLFVQIDVSKSGDEIVRYGRIVYDEDYRAKRQYFEGDDSKAMFLDTLTNDLSTLPEAKRNTLFYIHGMWAYKWSFLKGNLKKMQADLWANKPNPNGMIVTIIWHCKVVYGENKEMALKSGKILSPLVRQIHDITAKSSESAHTNYMIHSMGHRVFQEIWNGHLQEDMNYKANNLSLIQI